MPCQKNVEPILVALELHTLQTYKPANHEPSVKITLDFLVLVLVLVLALLPPVVTFTISSQSPFHISIFISISNPDPQSQSLPPTQAPNLETRNAYNHHPTPNQRIKTKSQNRNNTQRPIYPKARQQHAVKALLPPSTPSSPPQPKQNALEHPQSLFPTCHAHPYLKHTTLPSERRFRTP